MITNEQKLALEARINGIEAQLAEATKPQEPIGYDEIFNAIAEAASPCGEGIGVSVMAFKRAIGSEIFTTPQPCQRCADHVNEIKILKDEIDRLNAIKLTRFANDECWIWQGDGDDNLESLVCPVVIRPKVLADLINKCAELTSALAAKTADFDRLCKDFDEHNAELKRIIAGLRSNV